MSPGNMSSSRVFIFIALISWCKANAPQWVAPSDDSKVFEENFKEDGKCDFIVTVDAAFEDSVSISTVPASTDLFNIAFDGNTLLDFLHCDQNAMPDVSTTYTVTMSAIKTGETTANRIITIKHVVPGAGNSADPMFAVDSAVTIPINRNAFEDGNIIVTSFEVTDDDNDAVTLSVPDGTPFRVNGMQIEIGESLQNKNSTYVLVITATDNGEPPRSSQWTLTITLRSAPVFTDPVNFEVIPMCENDYDGQELAVLTASDDDVGDTLTYSLEQALTAAGDDAMELFEVIGDRLNVKADIPEGRFDVDAPSAVTLYVLTLKVSDGELFSTITVKLAVEDFNDHIPVLTGTWPSQINLLETATPDNTVLSLQVTDGDLTIENRDFTFSLTGSSKFTIDQTGVISQIETVAYAESPYILTITVIDTNDPDTRLTTSETLDVVIDTAPEFVDLANQYSVTENVDIGTEVLTFTVRDEDGAPESQLIVSIVDDNGVFEIADDKLITKTLIDAETQPSYTLKFSCTDGLYSTESIDVTISVNDVNDHSPTIHVTNHIVNENAEPGAVLVDVAVGDLDATSPNNQVTWTIETGEDFIDTTSNAIILLSKPSSMITKEFSLTITAVDNGVPPRSETMDVIALFNADVIDECEPGPCQNEAACTSFLNAYNCACTPGWKGDNCDMACDSNTSGQDCLEVCNCISAHVTNEVQHCDPITGECRCMETWEGTTCGTDVNECAQPGICDVAGLHKVCDNIDGGYECICEDGYLDVQGTCTENECLQNPCGNGGTCSAEITDSTIDFTCACTPGWKANTDCNQACDSNTSGQDCLEVCNCISAHVTNELQHCDPITGECRCMETWEGTTCETDVNECTQQDICDAVGEHRVCNNTDGGYECNCENEYREIQDTCQEDDCLQTPCENDGTCTDTMNGYTCACTPGWKPNTDCIQACDSNKFGRDCGEDCACNISRVTDEVQSCDPVTGNCKCKALWEGPDCETDVNECTVADPCKPNEHRVCINRHGSHICECKKHYEEIDGTCIKSHKEKEIIPPGLVVAEIRIRISSCPEGLDITSVYEEIKGKLEKQLEEIFQMIVTVYNIKCGSLVFDTAFNTGNQFGDKVALVSAIEDLKANGSIVYDNQTVPLSVTDIGFTKDGNDSTFLPDRDFCDGSVCYRCESANTVMTCSILPEDNQELIWALGGFMLCLVLCGSIVCLMVVCHKIRKSNAKRHKRKYSYRNGRRSMAKMDRSESDRAFGSTPWQEKYKSNDGPRLTRVESHRTSPYSIYNGRGFNGNSSFSHPPLYS